MLWRKVIEFWKSILVLGAIAYVSLMREPSIAMPHVAGIDKWIHSSMYLMLIVTLLWDSRKVTHQSDGKSVGAQRWKIRFIIVVFAAIYGGFIEVLQEHFFYPRTGDLLDWLADCIGVVVGLGLWIIGEKWYEQRMVK